MRSLLLALALSLAATPPAMAALAPGLYDASGKAIYVGIEHELPDPPHNEFFEPATGRTGELASLHGARLRCGVREVRHTVWAANGSLGTSLYYRTDQPRAAVILVHGADPETRQMGFIIPFFVCNGINVISYDQRGTGESPGNWFLSGPIQKSYDVDAIFDAYRSDRRIRSHEIGVWGFSNGGWVAPLVALHRPVAFMILKSAPTESVLSNIDYEATMEMRRHHATDRDITQALVMWHTVEDALYGTKSWSDARTVLAKDESTWWFRDSLMLKLATPPSKTLADGLRQAISYDPSGTLTSLTVPTLALYGDLDRKADAADSARHMRDDLIRGGATDVTVKMFSHASHTLRVSHDGYEPATPERYVPGYPEIMIDWLRDRGF